MSFIGTFTATLDGWYLMGDGEPRKISDEEAAALRSDAEVIGSPYLVDLRGSTATLWPVSDSKPPRRPAVGRANRAR